MKFVCLGYFDEAKWNALTQVEQKELMNSCMEYDAELHRSGHYAGGSALHPAATAVTVRHRDGKVSVTDGPFAETKEQLGGILIIEATDLQHAVQLIEQHPGVKTGPFEIRGTDEVCQRLAEAKREVELAAATVR